MKKTSFAARITHKSHTHTHLLGKEVKVEELEEESKKGCLLTMTVWKKNDRLGKTSAPLLAKGLIVG